MLVIIPSAGIGSRLELHTKNFNKAMIQLGDYPVISRIIESYPVSARFIVITGYKSQHIEEYLRLVYVKKKIKFVRIKLYDGSGSSLTHSLSKALKFINEPFFFHANDTIFTDKNFYKNINKDTMFLHKGKCDTMKFSTVELNKNYKKIHSKLSYLRRDYHNYTGVSYILSYKKFKKIIANSKKNEGEIEYFKSLNSNNINFKFIKGWHDIGSKETKEKAEFYFSNSKNILPKYDQGIFFNKNKVYKFFTDTNIIKKRYARSKILMPYVPRILEKQKYFYVYNFQKGTIFSRLKNKKKNFYKLLNWLNQFFWKKKKLNQHVYKNFKHKCYNFYYEKTLNRINYLYEKNNIYDQLETINNTKIPKLSKLFELINWEELNNGIPVNFHGDLHFENIIKNKNKFLLLDWRESFSDIKNYGDIYYDLAKINHGLIIDHSIIKKNKFNIHIKKKKIRINFFQSQENKDCQKILFNYIKQLNYSVKKVKILTSLIFLNISGLHHYPYSFFLYYLGKKLLHDSLKKR
jgi:NDP-sugar pyrophosphorylase family protein